MAFFLTTKDNPYDPNDHFDEWYAFDESHGYHSCSLVGRMANTSSRLSDELNSKIIDDAIEEIIKYDPLKIYTKVPVN